MEKFICEEMEAPMAAANQSKVKDPVCGMEISPRDAKASQEFQGTTYYFCSTACKEKFEKDMSRYAEEARVQPEIGSPR
jgi:P-type Cu+ transporter